MNQCILSAVKHLGSKCTTVLFVVGNMAIVSKAEERRFITNRSVPPTVQSGVYNSTKDPERPANMLN